MMNHKINQDLIIDNLNKYLSFHNLPLRMNNTGICNGLATVFAKYALENKDKEFLKMLEYIAGKEADSEIEIQVNHFVAEVVVSFLPEYYDKTLNQHNSIQTLAINNKRLRSIFDLALCTNDQNWAEIINMIALQQNEALLVGSINHRVTVVRKNAQYIIYDPNYASGIKEFSSEKELISELHTNVFKYSTDMLGMTISVVPHPDNSPREFPNIHDIYAKYLTPENINAPATTSDQHFRTLENAVILTKDTQVIQQLLDLGAIDIGHQAAMKAVKNNNTQTLQLLLPHIHDSKEIKTLFFVAILSGRLEAFDVLMEDQFFKEIFENSLFHAPYYLFHCCIKGGNVLLLNKIFDLYRYKFVENPYIESWISEKILQNKGDGDAIMTAIKHGQIGCLQMIQKQLNNTGYQLGDKEKMDYLLEAIHQNHPQMVSVLLEDIPKEAVQTITMNVLAVEKADLSILHFLREKGVPFSHAANAVIAQKENRSVSFILSIGIIFIKFTDFCREILFKNRGLNYNKKQFDEYQNKAQEEMVQEIEIMPADSFFDQGKSPIAQEGVESNAAGARY